jgi:ABC-type transporter Mla subunit MlaD
VDPFRLPRIPGLSELISALQTQAEALAALPRTLADLNGAVRELVAATRTATAALTSAQRTAERLEGLVEELEEPVRALRPGLERVGRVLDDPVVDTLPETLRRLSDDLVPVVSGLRSAQSRVEAVTGLLRPRRE